MNVEGQEQVEQVEGSDDDFMAGLDDAAPTVTPEPEQTNQENDTAQAGQAEPQQQEEQQQPAPKYVQVTEEQLNTLLARAAKIDEIDATLQKVSGTAFGKIGGIERKLSELGNRNGPGGQIDESDFEDLKREYPELADQLLKGLAKASTKFGGGSASPDEESINKLLAPRVEAIRQEASVEALSIAFPDWQAEVNSEPFQKWLHTRPNWKPEYADQAYTDVVLKDPNSPLRKFIAANPTDPVARVFSPKAADAAALLRDFGKSTATASAQATPSKRSQQLAAAVQPRGTGARVPARTEDDDFEAGLRGG